MRWQGADYGWGISGVNYDTAFRNIDHWRPSPNRCAGARLRQHGGDGAPGRPLQQVPDERAADAEAEHHELADAEVAHQADMVVGVGVPGPIDLERPRGLAAIGFAQICRDDSGTAR